MKAKQSDMTRIISTTIIIGALAMPYCTWIFTKLGFSMYFIIATDIMLAVCLVLTFKQRYTLKNLDFAQGNLLDVAAKLNKVKTHYHEWIKTAIPMIVVWGSWLIYEVFKYMDPSPMRTGFISGVVAGIVLGGFFGFRINRKIVDKSNEILCQIKELQAL